MVTAPQNPADRRSTAKQKTSRAPISRFRLVAVVPLAALLTFITIKVSAVEALSGPRPAEALALNAYHADTNANVARRLATLGELPQARVLAERAIARSPLEVAAYSALALVAEQSGRAERAARLMGRAHAISRRDVPTELWLAREAITEGRYERGLSHLDVALRSSSRSAPNLMALFVASTAEPKMVAALMPLLEKEPVWKSTFLMSLAIAGPELRNVVTLTRGRLDPSRDDERAVLARLIQRLAGEGEYELAWSFYREARPGLDANAAAGLRDEQYLADAGFPPFDWQIAPTPDLTALRQPRPDGKPGYALALIAEDGQSGEVARQLVRLAAGRHVIAFVSGDLPEDPRDRPRISIRCAGAGAGSLAEIAGQGSGTATTLTRQAFTIPPSCPWQTVSIMVRSAEGADARPWIAALRILPEG